MEQSAEPGHLVAAPRVVLPREDLDRRLDVAHGRAIGADPGRLEAVQVRTSRGGASARNGYRAVMAAHRVKKLGAMPGACTVCGAEGTLMLREVQDLRRWGPFHRRDREPYGVARCATCATSFAVRQVDLAAARRRRRWFPELAVRRPSAKHARLG